MIDRDGARSLPLDGERFGDDYFTVGYVVPQSGTAGMYGPSCEACGQLAIEKINAQGGINGREARLLLIDGGRARPSDVSAAVGRHLTAGRVDAISGWHISAVRSAIADVVQGRVPYVYAALHEGGVMDPDVVYSGEHPNMQIRPALEWLRTEMGVRRWALVGNDYIWPRRTAQFIRTAARHDNLFVEKEFYVPLNTADFGPIIKHLAEDPPDGVLMLLVGNDAVSFSRAFDEAGLTQRIIRYSPIVEENAILANTCAANDNLYVSAGYFDTLMTPEALDFATAYHARFSATATAPRLNSIGESCYEALLLLREITTQPRRASPMPFETPRGEVVLRGNQVQQDVYIAQACGYEFEILAQVASTLH